MSTNSSRGNSALIPSDAVECDLATDKKAAKALDSIKAKYPHALTDKVWRHEKKIGVLISCTVPGCDGRRFTHSSDLFQVKHCGSPDHSAKGEKKAKAPSRVSLKYGRKASRKAPKGGKRSPRARRARSATPAKAS
jgi:hypothetical protein